MVKTYNPNIMVVGDLNNDFLGSIPYFPKADEEVVVHPLNNFLGGSGANFSVAAKRLGLDVSFFSAVGDDANGLGLLTSIKEHGVSIDNIKQMADIPTGMVFGVIEPDGVRRLFCFRGANLSLLPDDISDEDIAMAHWVHLNGPEFNMAVDILNRAHITNKPTSLDPGSILIEEHNIDDILSLTSILFLNEVEFDKLSEGQNYLERAVALHKKGANWVVLKHGSRGSLLFRKDQTPIVECAYEIQSVDSTGAGDAFNAGFLYGVIKEFELQEALKFANAIGALTTLSVGATTGIPSSINEIKHFMTHTLQRSCELTLQ